MRDSDTAIHVTNLSKTFKLPHEKYTSIKSLFINFYRRKKSYESQKALNNVSLEIKKGEFFGIVGRNGSGKSTLLKMLAEIYVPDSGEVWVNGKLTPFIELGVGFNMELTGRENVFLNGALLGFSRKEMQVMYNDIVEFAELESFMDQKLKNYSSGMQVRLAFSIAIRAESDILLIDEVLAVGDANFQKKCLDVFRDIKRSGRTVVFVTHDMETMQMYCDRALLLDKGMIDVVGTPRQIGMRYEALNTYINKDDVRTKRPRNPKIKIDKIEINNSSKSDTNLMLKDDIKITVKYTAKAQMKAQFNALILKSDGGYYAGLNTTEDLGNLTLDKGSHAITCIIKAGQLIKGDYRIGVGVYTIEEPADLIDILDFGNDSPTIHVLEKSPTQSGDFYISGHWEIEK